MGQLVSGATRDSGYESNPDYLIRLAPAGLKVEVRLNGHTVAKTEKALELFESNHAPVLYIPRSDVVAEYVQRTDHTSWCPYKGRASYYAVRTPEGEVEDAAWSYEDPFVQMADIQEMVAFYADKVEIVTESL
ncbi:uncharacterized protein (DUF427 family) [Parvibaculum indicum]|uniref:DUF427 domain-containing protein n=1 Tax=Parvibaculum indicum TaxID=562969 RepID=UPI001420B0BA|nr:DUF427 domain-containing protein [Parvibaculum indicum]NIJ41209.1 uncharacterized protein (DUF427 family) [Parvibaculum indicum]